MRALLVALLALSLAACATAEAAPAVVPAPPPTPHPAVALVERLEASQAAAMPDLIGESAQGARGELEAMGLQAQLVALDTSPTVSAQYPPAGTARPADGVVTVWLGAPPLPPPAAEPPPDGEQAAPEPSTSAAISGSPPPAAPAPEPTGSAAPTPPPAPAPTPTPTPAPPPPTTGAGEQPPKRANIRTLPPAEPGTVLIGAASWYGPGFAGRQTACGGIFDPKALTLASRELRCGTLVEVTGPGGASVRATVSDWGPAEWTDRRFDLSEATFAAIHHLGAGVIDITVTVVE